MGTARPSMHRTWLAILTLGVVLVGCAAVAAPAGSSAPSSAPSDAPSSTSTSAVPTDPDRLLAAAIQRLDPTVFVSTELTKKDNGWWFDATLLIDGPAGCPEARPMWMANLAQGAVAEELATGATLNTGIRGSTFIGRRPDGTSLGEIGGGGGDVPRGQTFPTPADDQTIVATITRTAARFGLRVVDIHVYRPVDGAVSVILQQTEPTSALGDGQQVMNLINPIYTPIFEGVYLEFRDPSGRTLGCQATARRLGAGITALAGDPSDPFGLHPGGMAMTPSGTTGR